MMFFSSKMSTLNEERYINKTGYFFFVLLANFPSEKKRKMGKKVQK